jgi:hypothetical protein
MSQINEFCAYYESMGMLATVLPEPDSRGLVPAIHVFLLFSVLKTWMPGTSPGMTNYVLV